MINIQENILLSQFTSFRIGGPARFYVEVSSVDELKEALLYAKEKNIKFFILGGGTNLLMSDNGFQGIVIRMKINTICTNGNIMEVGCGVPLIKAINVSATEELSGMESLAGIPGTVGGAIRGNAGAFGSEICACVEKVSALDSETMEVVSFDAKECDFSYRTSVFKQKEKFIVLSATFALTAGNDKEIQQKVSDTINKRVSTGLHGVRSAGSFFMNPFVESKDILDNFEKDNGSPSRNG
ncbi:MAG: UDP-N-acetylenolpyruvoylglucosamine reductase, partial [Candidatus Moranbacteria bacterium GW2011_GWE1_36_7]